MLRKAPLYTKLTNSALKAAETLTTNQYDTLAAKRKKIRDAKERSALTLEMCNIAYQHVFLNMLEQNEAPRISSKPDILQDMINDYQSLASNSELDEETRQAIKERLQEIAKNAASIRLHHVSQSAKTIFNLYELLDEAYKDEESKLLIKVLVIQDKLYAHLINSQKEKGQKLTLDDPKNTTFQSEITILTKLAEKHDIAKLCLAKFQYQLLTTNSVARIHWVIGFVRNISELVTSSSADVYDASEYFLEEIIKNNLRITPYFYKKIIANLVKAGIKNPELFMRNKSDSLLNAIGKFPLEAAELLYWAIQNKNIKLIKKFIRANPEETIQAIKFDRKNLFHFIAERFPLSDFTTLINTPSANGKNIHDRLFVSDEHSQDILYSYACTNPDPKVLAYIIEEEKKYFAAFEKNPDLSTSTGKATSGAKKMKGNHSACDIFHLPNYHHSTEKTLLLLERGAELTTQPSNKKQTLLEFLLAKNNIQILDAILLAINSEKQQALTKNPSLVMKLITALEENHYPASDMAALLSMCAPAFQEQETSHELFIEALSKLQAWRIQSTSEMTTSNETALNNAFAVFLHIAVKKTQHGQNLTIEKNLNEVLLAAIKNEDLLLLQQFIQENTEEDIHRILIENKRNIFHVAAAKWPLPKFKALLETPAADHSNHLMDRLFTPDLATSTRTSFGDILYSHACLNPDSRVLKYVISQEKSMPAVVPKTCLPEIKKSVETSRKSIGQHSAIDMINLPLDSTLTEKVRLLIKRGADLSVISKRKQISALDFLLKNHNSTIVRYILDSILSRKQENLLKQPTQIQGLIKFLKENKHQTDEIGFIIQLAAQEALHSDPVFFIDLIKELQALRDEVATPTDQSTINEILAELYKKFFQESKKGKLDPRIGSCLRANVIEEIVRQNIDFLTKLVQNNLEQDIQSLHLDGHTQNIFHLAAKHLSLQEFQRLLTTPSLSGHLIDRLFKADRAVGDSLNGFILYTYALENPDQRVLDYILTEEQQALALVDTSAFAGISDQTQKAILFEKKNAAWHSKFNILHRATNDDQIIKLIERGAILSEPISNTDPKLIVTHLLEKKNPKILDSILQSIRAERQPKSLSLLLSVAKHCRHENRLDTAWEMLNRACDIICETGSLAASLIPLHDLIDECLFFAYNTENETAQKANQVLFMIAVNIAIHHEKNEYNRHLPCLKKILLSAIEHNDTVFLQEFIKKSPPSILFLWLSEKNENLFHLATQSLSKEDFIRVFETEPNEDHSTLYFAKKLRGVRAPAGHSSFAPLLSYAVRNPDHRVLAYIIKRENDLLIESKKDTCSLSASERARVISIKDRNLRYREALSILAEYDTESFLEKFTLLLPNAGTLLLTAGIDEDSLLKKLINKDPAALSVIITALKESRLPALAAHPGTLSALVALAERFNVSKQDKIYLLSLLRNASFSTEKIAAVKPAAQPIATNAVAAKKATTPARVATDRNKGKHKTPVKAVAQNKSHATAKDVPVSKDKGKDKVSEITPQKKTTTSATLRETATDKIHVLSTGKILSSVSEQLFHEAEQETQIKLLNAKITAAHGKDLQTRQAAFQRLKLAAENDDKHSDYAACLLASLYADNSAPLAQSVPTVQKSFWAKLGFQKTKTPAAAPAIDQQKLADTLYQQLSETGDENSRAYASWKMSLRAAAQENGRKDIPFIESQRYNSLCLAYQLICKHSLHRLEAKQYLIDIVAGSVKVDEKTQLAAELLSIIALDGALDGGGTEAKSGQLTAYEKWNAAKIKLIHADKEILPHLYTLFTSTLPESFMATRENQEFAEKEREQHFLAFMEDFPDVPSTSEMTPSAPSYPLDPPTYEEHLQSSIGYPFVPSIHPEHYPYSGQYYTYTNSYPYGASTSAAMEYPGYFRLGQAQHQTGYHYPAQGTTEETSNGNFFPHLSALTTGQPMPEPSVDLQTLIAFQDLPTDQPVSRTSASAISVTAVTTSVQPSSLLDKSVYDKTPTLFGQPSNESIIEKAPSVPNDDPEKKIVSIPDKRVSLHS